MYNKKIIFVISTLLMLCMLLGACATQTDGQAIAQTSAAEPPAPTPDATPKAAAEPKESPAPEKTISPTPEPAKAANSSVSDDWTDCEFSFDGKTYTLPHSYSDFAAGGWTFDLADYGYDDGYVLNKNDMTYSTIKLENSSYNEQLSVSVGFVNPGQDAADITECSIWSFECDSMYGFDPLDNIPSVMLPKGITWGSSEDDVTAAYGEPDDIYDATDSGYKVYTYESDNIYYKLNIFANGGVSLFSIQKYV